MTAEGVVGYRQESGGSAIQSSSAARGIRTDRPIRMTGSSPTASIVNTFDGPNPNSLATSPAFSGNGSHRGARLDAEYSSSVGWRQLKTVLIILAVMSVTACGQSSTSVSGPAPVGKVVAEIRQSTPRDVEAGFGSIWVSNGPSRSVTRIDPTTDKVIAKISLDDPPSVLAVSADAIWVTSFPGVRVTRIDPVTNLVVGTVDPGGSGPVGVAVFDGYVWVANHKGNPTGSVAKIDPAKMKVVDLIHLGSASDSGPQWFAVSAGSLWVSVVNINSVVRIDPINDTVVATIPVSSACGEIVANDHDVWVAGGCGPGVTHIDPATNSVTRVTNEVGSGPALALGEGSVWFGTSITLDRIDPNTRKFVGQMKLPGPSFGASAAFGYVWITDKDDELLFKIKPA